MVPPSNFIWNYRDRDFQYHNAGKITPIKFYKKYVNINLEDYISLINCPTQDNLYNKHYTVKYLGNIIEGGKVSYINVDINIIKELVIKTLKTNEPVWLGCDVRKNLSIDDGILDQNLFNFEELYGTSFQIKKSTMVDYRHSKMTHAMLLVGVHEENGVVKRWKVENSWGEKREKWFF